MNLEAPEWLVAWLQSVNLWDAILIAAAVVGVIVFLRRKGWRWLKSFAKAVLKTADVIENVGELPDFIAEMRAINARNEATFAEHTRQLKNSHSSNLRDDVTAALVAAEAAREAAESTATSVEGLHGRMDAVETQVTALARADDEIRAELEQTQPPKENT
ncbi:hypothetical protein [Microbacterium jejuense]|uniref:hypothetical protein n=1 Tax=Microbacterium jejuense TaxID=1263637 RepID=UPI0031EA0D1C